MKRIVVSLPLFLLAGSLAFLMPSFAHAGQGDNNYHQKGSAHKAMFNPSTIETVNGKVMDITTHSGKKGMAAFERLDLKTDKGTIPVVLGPASYVDKENVKVKKGDDISVTGSRVTMHKKSELVATQIKDGSKTLDLRKSDGTPLWSSKTAQGK